MKGMVALHGGTVRAESDGPGRGARMTFELPAEAPSDGELRPAATDRG